MQDGNDKVKIRSPRTSGFLTMFGQVVDVTIIAAPKQRNVKEEKQALEKALPTVIGGV